MYYSLAIPAITIFCIIDKTKFILPSLSKYFLLLFYKTYCFLSPCLFVLVPTKTYSPVNNLLFSFNFQLFTNMSIGSNQLHISRDEVTVKPDDLLQMPKVVRYMSRLMGKPTVCIGENKGADQLRSNCEADQRLCFRYSDSTIPLLLKSEISSF